MDQLFSAATRRANLDALAADTVDLLVVGGGITGAGIARDAAMRGLSTALVDAGDFGRGTSSRSSRLVHGGLRYLEHGWLRLVFESSRERAVLLRIAPHLVRPTPFLFPVHASGRVGRWTLAAGLWLYDALSLFRNVRRHRGYGRKGVRRLEPALREQDLRGGAVYYDARCDDARLTLATVRAAHRHGARVANYVAVTGFEKAGGRLRGAHVDDRITGARLTLHAHVIVNATGPWTDLVRRLDEASAPPLLRPTKGAHVVVPRHRIAHTEALTLTSPLDGRVMFVLPWGDLSIIGTTDTDVAEVADEPLADVADVTYLLRSANAYFPNARLALGDVVSAWAGLRPLLAAPGATSTAAVPREHRLVESASGLVTIAGGKLTTFRSMAAEVVDRVARRLRTLDGRRVPAAAGTDVEALPGGEVADLDLIVRDLVGDDIDEAMARVLVSRYGSEAAAVANLAQREPALARPVAPGQPVLAAEVVHQARREMAMTVADVLVRRTRRFLEDPQQATDAAAAVAGLLAPELGWGEADVEREVQAYRDEAARMRRAITPAPSA
ncbi:MAG: glycerol-3-phosphate dehydrogenase/oxidase [Gemmatimonadota bacterium]